VSRVRALRIVLLAAVPAVVGACSWFGSDESAECVSEEEYQSAEVAPRLQVPSGLDSPETAGRLDVPDGPLPDEPLSRNAACLQRPPDYFDRPLVPAEKPGAN